MIFFQGTQPLKDPLKIHVNLFLYFTTKTSTRPEGAIVRGVISCPDRPLEGDTIYWPFGLHDFTGAGSLPENQHASLSVIFSDYFTNAVGKISPVIDLEESRNEPDKVTIIETLDHWESVFDGVRLLIPNAVVKWPRGGTIAEPWPSSAHHLPDYLRNNLSQSDPEQ